MSANRNHTLAWALAALDWSPERLARELNRELATVKHARTVSPNSPAQWRDENRVPRVPIPRLAAHVLSRALDRPLSVDELWQGRAHDQELLVPADFGLDVPWTPEGTVELLNVVRGDRMLRREFMLIGGAALYGPAFDWATTDPGPLAAAVQGDRVTPAILTYVESSIAALRHVDDAGNGHVLTATEGLHAYVSDLLRAASYDGRTARRLLQAAAEIGQLAGWVCSDQGQEARAQRWYLTGLRAAHSADDRPLGAHLLNSMARQAMRLDRPKQAVTMLEAAQHGVDGTSMPVVKAALAGFEARAHAQVGDEAAAGAALTLAHRHHDRTQHGELPRWAYWMRDAPDRNFALAAGEAFASLGPRHLSRAEQHLSRGMDQLDDAYVRSKAAGLPLLAEVQLRRRDLDQACATARQALRLSLKARSRRGLDAVCAVRDKLRQDIGTPVVDTFLAESRNNLAAV